MGRDSRQFSTGEAAKLLSVEPDTVLKWIKKGKLTAATTAGGHHRIDSREIDRLLEMQRAGGAAISPPERFDHPMRCWEYLNQAGEVREECRRCVVYRVRAAFCFELLRLAGELVDTRQFCRGSCEECCYYQRVAGARTKVLVISSDAALLRRLEEADAQTLELRAVANGYCASALLETFRPAFAVVDRDASPGGWRELIDCLRRDPRLPGLKVVLVVPRTALRGRTARPRGVVGVLGKPFGPEGLVELIASLPVETIPKEAESGQPRESG